MLASGVGYRAWLLLQSVNRLYATASKVGPMNRPMKPKAINPPNVLVNIPKRACRFYEFYKAPELIALGRIVAHDALVRYEEEQ